MTSSPPLILPTNVEFRSGLEFLYGDGPLADIKRQLVPVALEVFRDALVGHIHPFEGLQNLVGMHWQGVIGDPQTPSAVNRLLDAIELHPRLQGVVGVLCHPAVMQRMRVEWLHEMTTGRFEHSLPFLLNEDELLESWGQFCGGLRESSINPFEAAEKEALRRLSSRGGDLTVAAQRLHRLSFLAACRKLFVHFSGAKETWAGAYTFHAFKLSEALAEHPGQVARDDPRRGERLSLCFGRVEHVFYLKPTLEQLQLYLNCIIDPELTTQVQRKMCPFICADAEESNLLAELFYRIYLPGCSREIRQPAQVDMDEGFVQESRMKKEFFRRFRFLPLSADTVAPLSEEMEASPRLRAFLHHPRTESGLVRRRLCRGILEPMLADVVQKAAVALARQWNPLLRTEEGAALLLMDHVESKALRVAGDDPKSAALRERVIFDELLKILDRNTQSWQDAFSKDGFIVDRARNYFITILAKAIEGGNSEEARRARFQDYRRLACVVAE